MTFSQDSFHSLNKRIETFDLELLPKVISVSTLLFCQSLRCICPSRIDVERPRLQLSRQMRLDLDQNSFVEISFVTFLRIPLHSYIAFGNSSRRQLKVHELFVIKRDDFFRIQRFFTLFLIR